MDYSILYVIALIFMGKLLSEMLPSVYQNVRAKVILNNKGLENEGQNVKSYPYISISFLLSSVLTFALTENIYLSIYVFIFACIAYVDYAVRWIPDILIYAMTWLSFIGLDKTIFDGGLSVLLFCFPALLIYCYSYVRNGDKCIESGDWYVFPSVGLWLSPDVAALYMVVCLGIVIVFSRFTKDVPLITCLFPVFLGGQLCEFYRLF